MFRQRSAKARVSLYVSLGLTKKASHDDIQRAFKLIHPKCRQDVEAGKKGAKRKLKEVEKAYGILNDPNKRAMYDEHGTVGWWGKLRRAFSPENIDKQNPCVRGLWSCCFAATGCCFCYFCCFCCGKCRTPDTEEYEEDEIYIRAQFPEYLTDSPANARMSPFGRRREMKDIKEAARRRRRDIFMKKGATKSPDAIARSKGDSGISKDDSSISTDDSLKSRDDSLKSKDDSLKSKDSVISKEDDKIPTKECKDEEEKKKTEPDEYPKKRSLVSKDSGLGFMGLDNPGFVTDLDDGLSIGEKNEAFTDSSRENSIKDESPRHASIEIHVHDDIGQQQVESPDHSSIVDENETENTDL